MKAVYCRPQRGHAKHALRKHFADSGLTNVVKPNSQDYRLKNGKVMEGVVAARVQLLTSSAEDKRKPRLYFRTHDSGALFSLTAKRQRGQAVIKANHAARRQTARRLDATLVRAATTKPGGSAASEKSTPEGANAALLEGERNRRHDNNECMCVACKSHATALTPKSSGDGVNAQSHGQSPEQQQFTSGTDHDAQSKKDRHNPCVSYRSSKWVLDRL